MNFRTLFTLFALSIPVALVACSSAPDAEEEESDSTEDALTARQQLQGSWKEGGAGGLDLRPLGQFFWDDANGDRKEGSWRANKRYNRLTIKVGGSETVFRYIYTPAIVANGFPGPGGSLPHQPAKLELQQLIPMTTVAVIHKLTQADSYCASPVDCMLEQQDNTWEPTSAMGTPKCKSNHTCAMGSSSVDTVVANCGPVHVLNGFVAPMNVWHAQITRHQPIILNGFALPAYKVVVKQGANVVAELTSCTGNLDDWNLHCNPDPHGPLGVMKVFELSDEAHLKGQYKSGVISPTAPVETHDFRCTLENN